MHLSYLEEKDLILFKCDTSFWINEYAVNVQIIKSGCIGLVLENSFGATYKERYVSILVNGNAIKIYLTNNHATNYSKQIEIIRRDV